MTSRHDSEIKTGRSRTMRGRLRAGLVGALALGMSLVVVSGAGATSYTQTGTIGNGVGLPIGVAVDQSNGNVYLGEFIGPAFSPGFVARFDSAGNALDPATVGSSNFTGMAVNPLTGDVYGATGIFSAKEALGFSQAGTSLGAPFPITLAAEGDLLQMAATSTSVFAPNVRSNTVTEFSVSTGAVLQTITCSTCSGPPALAAPSSVAVDSVGNIYVVSSGNKANGSRLIKFGPEGDSDPAAPVVFGKSGPIGTVGAVAVNPANDHVFTIGNDEHPNPAGIVVTEYDPEGNVVSEFGKGSFKGGVLLITGEPAAVPGAMPQLAIDGDTGKVYVADIASDASNGYALVFSPVPSPSATTEAATAVSSNKATLNGKANPNGLSTEECRFEYTTKTSFEADEFTGAQTASCSPNPEEASTDVAVSAAVEGLSASTTYVFRLIEETEGGIAEGSELEFTTLAAKPKATTEAATGVSQAAVTLNGKVDAEGNTASCKFEYGTTIAYGQSLPCAKPNEEVTGTANTAVSVALSGLSASTTYHYRVVASNVGGTTNGSDLTFTTAAHTCATNAALCPPPVVTPPVTTTPPPVTTTPPTTKKPLKCKKGFKKKTVKGKQKCVKVKKKKKK